MSVESALRADLNDAHVIATSPKRRTRKPKCTACLVGDCFKCVRDHCYHRCPNPRRVGVASPAAGIGHDHREGK